MNSKSPSRSSINSGVGISRTYSHQNSASSLGSGSVIQSMSISQIPSSQVLISGQSVVKPVNLVSISSKSHSAQPSAHSSNNMSGGTFFLTEVNTGDSHQASNVPAPSVSTAINTQTTATAQPTKSEPRYMSMIKNIDIKHYRGINNISDLPPVQNLGNIAQRANRKAKADMIKSIHRENNAHLASNGIGAAAYHSGDNQFSQGNARARRQYYPLRQAMRRNNVEKLTNNLLKTNDYAIRFSEHFPLENNYPEPEREPVRDNMSVYSGESRASRHSHKSIRSQAESHRSTSPENLPLISSPHSPKSVVSSHSHHSDRSLHSSHSHASTHSHRSNNSHLSTSSVRSHHSTHSTRSHQSDRLSVSHNDSGLAEETASVVSKRSSKSNGSSASKRSRRSEAFSIGSDAENDRIVQLEEHLRAEEEARKNVQKVLEEIAQKQDALLKRLDAKEREEFYRLNPHLKSTEASQPSADPVAIWL